MIRGFKTDNYCGCNFRNVQNLIYFGISFIHPFILQSPLRKVHSPLHSEFPIECDLVFPLLVSSILSFP
jgi:hypothetical protein